jgi:hypothetical protein
VRFTCEMSLWTNVLMPAESPLNRTAGYYILLMLRILRILLIVEETWARL